MSILATGIYCRLKDEQEFRGPFSEEQVLEWYRSGSFTSTTAFHFVAEDTVVTLGELCDKNGNECPFSGEKESRANEAHTESHDVQLRRMQEQIDATNRLLHTSVARCTKLEQIVSSVVERFLLFSGELTDVKAEWKSIRNTPCVTGASPSVTSSTTTLASAASSSSSLNLLMQLKDDMNALENALRGGKDHNEETRLGEAKTEKTVDEERRSENGGPAGDLILFSPRPLSSSSLIGGGVRRTDSCVSTASTAKRTISSEEDEGDETMMETVDELPQPRPASLPYLHLATTVYPTGPTAESITVEYEALTRRIATLESGLREASRIEEMKAADISHVLESIDRVSEEMCASQNELKDDLMSVKTIRNEVQAAKDRDEFTEMRMDGIDDKLRGQSDELEQMAVRVAILEEATTKMLTLDSFKAMLTNHTDELSSQMRKTSEDILEGTEPMDKVEQTTSQDSLHEEEMNEAVEDILDDTQSSDCLRTSANDEDGEVTANWDPEECTCSMCGEGKTPKVISDLLNGHRGHFDQARIATRADLIDIRDALSVRRTRSSFVDDTRHYFGEGVHCDHCDVTIREGVSLLSHVSSERHSQSTCILKEDLSFWWNRIRNADE